MTETLAQAVERLHNTVHQCGGTWYNPRGAAAIVAVQRPCPTLALLAEHRDERTFTAEEVIEIANETSDSLGNLYRLDFIDRIRHEAERPAPEPPSDDTGHINLVFDGPPSRESSLIKVEDEQGRSINGRWIMPDGDVYNRDTPVAQVNRQSPSGSWRLRVPVESPEPPSNVTEDELARVLSGASPEFAERAAVTHRDQARRLLASFHVTRRAER